MPDANGKLSPQDVEKVRNWLRDHWKNWACPFSHDTNWELGGSLAQAPLFSSGNIVVGGPVYPYVVISCSSCGYTVLINAIKIGILPAKEGANVNEKPS